MIQVSPGHLQQICTHAERTYPEECCGLLLGTINEDRKVLIEVRQAENCWDEAETFAGIVKPGSNRDRFSIAPQVMLQVQKEARDRHLAIVGIYHSHPNHPAIPSEFDRAIAWQQYSYIIVSVVQGRVGDLYSWTLDDDRQFQSEDILTLRT